MEQNKLTGYPSIDKPWLKYYSEEAINVTLPKCTIYEYLFENNKDDIDDVALNYFNRKISFRELFEKIDEASKAFSALGVKKGDIIIMSTVTTPETIYAFYGLNRIGAVANMVDPRTSIGGIKEYITEVNAKYVLTIDAAYPKIQKAILGTNVKTVILVSPADSLPQPKKFLFFASNRIKGATLKFTDNCLSWDSFIKNGKSARLQSISYQQNSCCVIVHTGGTTGTPKGVMLSNDNLNIMALQYRLLGANYRRGQKFLNIMPPFIAYGIVLGTHMALTLGLENVIIPQFDPEKFADLVKKYRPEHLVGAPTYYEKLCNSSKMKDFRLDFFESAGVGGDGLSARFEEKINLFLKNHDSPHPIAKGYGMTETSAASVTCHGNINKPLSVGVPHIFTTVAIFDPDTNRELSYGKHGEICIQTLATMLGYYAKSEETAKIIKKHNDGSIWIHSGDIGYMDEDGFLFVEGRIKRMIIRHDGFKVFPSFIEDVISKHEYVDSCCAVGTPDKQHSQGMLPIVHVVLKSDTNGQDDAVRQELIALCHKDLPEYAQPVDFVFHDALPLTPIGKVDYRALEKITE